MMSLRDVAATYGRRWTVSAGAGGGFYAVRTGNLSQYAQDQGLSLVVCGANITDLARGLEQQTRLEARLLGRTST